MYIKVMLKILVTPVNYVDAKKRLTTHAQIFSLWNNADISKVALGLTFRLVLVKLDKLLLNYLSL